MKIIEASGSGREVGRITGEALREEIHYHVELYPPEVSDEEWERRFARFLPVLERHLPEVLEEMAGTAEGADIPLETIYKLNLPLYADSLYPEQECTNVVFSGGPDGPIWGKNNDGNSRQHPRPAHGRLVRRDDAIPTVVFTFCGMVATTDGMNAEGVAVGHSSVGSIYQQSDDYVPIRLWAYECLMHSRSTRELVRKMSSLPTRGKGYSHACVDREGVTCSIEAPCPVFQIRWPEAEHGHMNCTNYYQLPALAEADRRRPDGKLNAIARRAFLDDEVSQGKEMALEDMKRLLRHHGEPSICRHGGADMSFTEYSMIGLPRDRKVLYMDGNPCEGEFEEVDVG